MTAIPQALSPCRRHPCSREHAAIVETFRELAAGWRAAAERATGGYEREMELYRQSHPRPQLKAFLVLSRRPRGDELSDGRAA